MRPTDAQYFRGISNHSEKRRTKPGVGSIISACLKGTTAKVLTKIFSSSLRRKMRCESTPIEMRVGKFATDQTRSALAIVV